MPTSDPTPSRPTHGPELSGAGYLCLLAMLNHMALTGGRITVSLTALKLGLSTFTVGMLVAVFAVLPMFASVHAGRWVDKIGVVRPLVIGSSLVTFGTALPFVSQTQAALLVASCCIGIGFMLHQVATQDLLGHAEPRERLRNFSWMSLALAASGFSGPLIAGLAIDHLGTRLAFGMLALGPMLSLVGLYLLRQPLRTMNGALTGGSNRPAERRRITELLAVPPLRRILMVNTILSGAWDTHLFVVPIFGVAIGLSATTIGVILAAFAAATFVIRLVLPFIQTRVRSWTLVRAAMATAAIDFLLYPFFTDVGMLIGLSFVLGLALGCCQPSMLSLLHQYSPPGRAAEAVGLRMALINASQVSLPLTFGALGAVIGVAPLFWAYALALVAGGWANRNPPQESDSSKSS
ncbi:MFS transporter [Bordetella bronchiseptica]|uniref:MFS transporter n=1 Tax=Bordetella bronchiseptica TaxID=518 RepID=UPI00045B45B5|nr:MFS transporter [Bordetella bronchiseptica]AZW32434.1 MFS transporter [Bordetella bronchiseptica]KCV41249.1 transporter, major facilitator family protein [Bordetella bronchiseptica 345]